MINYTTLVNKNTPVIVQIGAHDGVLGEEYGLQDLLNNLIDFKLFLIEPIDEFFNNLPSVYGKYGDKVQYIKCAISDKNGVINMIDQGCMSKIDDSGNIPVDSITWNKFILDNNINKVDLLVLDCEGYEFNILSQINFSEVKPSVIRYEYFWLPNKEECDNYLTSNGYQIELCEHDHTYNKIAFI
jgi:FkbM family methyltransferase